MATIQKREKKDGSFSYVVQIRIQGKKENKTFQKLTKAKQYIQKTETAIRDGQFAKTENAKKHTLAEAVDRYVKNIIPTMKSGVQRKQRIIYWKDELGHLTLNQLIPSIISEQRDILSNTKAQRKDTNLSPSTVNRYLAALSHLCSVAYKDWEWLDHNPVISVNKMKEGKSRDRILSDDERKSLLKACRRSSSPDLYLGVVLALSTGARRGEIEGLNWDQVNFERETIILYETKNSLTRVLQLKGKALELMKERSRIRRLDTNLVFPSRRWPDKPIQFRRPWENALKKAEIKDFRWHDLRHTACTLMAMEGCTEAELMKFGGWKSPTMVNRYTHLMDSQISDKVKSMNQKIFG